jgi:SAM-dependent methyltransferase
MSIGKLIKFKERAKNNIDLVDISIAINKKMNRLLTIVKDIDDIELSTLVSPVCSDQMKLFDDLIQNSSTKLAKILDVVELKISDEGKLLSSRTPPETDYESLRHSRAFNYSDYMLQLLLGRISKYSSWQYPAMEINPRRPSIITTKLVASDPLYLVELEFEKVLTDALSIFTPEYQARLRPYFISGYDFSILPKEQFGFVISVNSFDFINSNSIEQYMKAIYPLLLPGGTFLFTYNNCEIPVGAMMAEENVRSYVTQTTISEMAVNIGYEIAETFNLVDHQQLSWVEIKKPGTLNTIKGHQALGAIKDIE